MYVFQFRVGPHALLVELSGTAVLAPIVAMKHENDATYAKCTSHIKKTSKPAVKDATMYNSIVFYYIFCK